MKFFYYWGIHTRNVISEITIRRKLFRIAFLYAIRIGIIIFVINVIKESTPIIEISVAWNFWTHPMDSIFYIHFVLIGNFILIAGTIYVRFLAMFSEDMFSDLKFTRTRDVLAWFLLFSAGFP